MKCRSCKRALGAGKLFCEACGTLAAVRLSPQEAEGLLKSVDRLLTDGHTGQARKLLEGIISVEPGNAAAFNALGAVYLEGRQHSRADYCFKKALFIDGSLRPAVENLKKLNTVSKRKLTPREKAVTARLEELRKGGGTPDVVRELEDIIRKNPKAIEGYNDLGLLHFQHKDYDRAEETLVRGLEQYYVGGMQVDHQYFILKENLGKLRDAREESIKAERPSHDPLAPGEQALATVAGDIRVSRTGELRKHGMFITTNRRIILLWPEPTGTEQEWQEETLPYESVKGIRINFGIVRAVMVISSRTEELSFSTLSKDEAKTALTIVRSMMRKTSETAVVDDIIVKASDMSNKTAVLLLKALNELNVLTDDEYRHKVTAVERVGPPDRQPSLSPPPARMRSTQ